MNAATLRLTLIAAAGDHVNPQSTESVPLRPAAIEPSVVPSRTRAPVCGSRVPTDCTADTAIGGDHVTPLSDERITYNTAFAAPIVFRRVKNSTSVPSGNTTIWLLIVCVPAPGS